MKNTLTLSTILFLLILSACSKKDSSTATASTKPQFQWTYLGTTQTADTVQATAAVTMIINPGDTFTSLPEIYAQTGPWSSPIIAFDAKISSLNAGTYTQAGQNEFTEGTDDIYPFVLTISSNANGKINGSFSGTYLNQPISGTFVNVPIH